jgi:hypothetical protein
MSAVAKAKTDAERARAVLDGIVDFTMKLPEVVESTSYGKPALKRGEKLIFALRDEETLALTCSFEERALLLEEHPGTFFITDHFLNWPAVVVRLAGAEKKVLQAAVTASWERAGGLASKRRKNPKAAPRARRL